MEPNNIENQIREKLNSREIKPTEMAWDRLDAMLSVAEEKKTARSPFLSSRFIGIAAGVLVLVSLGLFFFNQKETVVKPENNVVVNEEVKQNNSKQNTNSINGNTGIDNSGLEGFDEQVKQRANQQKEENKTIITQSSKSFNQNNQKTTVNPIINQNKEIQFQNNEVVAQKELPVIESKKEFVSKPSAVNVDDLLASVEKTPKSTPKPKVKVNANSLLSQVDGELDQTFREKVINRVSKNYQEVKVALATRNQE